MSLILILRSEMACGIMLVFLYFMSRTYNIENTSGPFKRILTLALSHVLFDITTVITVNNLSVVPNWVNWLCHVIFYITAILFSNEIVNYVIDICYPKLAKRMYMLGHGLIAAYIFSLSFLRIDYGPDVGTNSSTGPAAYVGYGLAFLFFISALVLVFTHWKQMSTSIKSALIPMMLVLMCTEVAQIIWRNVLFTGGAVTIVTLGFFFSLENPVEVFKKKAMIDALTGVRSRSSYEEDIKKADAAFRAAPNEDYIFVFCDIKDLRAVNNRLGHAEGDNYIMLIASAISTCLKSASSVYRIGGDEFLVLYYQKGEEIVTSEIKALQESCRKATEEVDYTVSVSCGYAQSSAQYTTLEDVIKTADYAMYQNKARFAESHSYESATLGTKLNHAGLTDKMFDAVCASNDTNYPYITNMTTNVTRISPAWKEFFGLDSEFYFDFASFWIERVHPDDREGYTNDIISVINGRKKYHRYDYYAKKANGEYVKVTCNGSLYKDVTSGTSYFTGFIVNHGMEENIDKTTSLRSFDTLTNIILRKMDQQERFALMKLKLNSFARVNMLYGYETGNHVLRGIAKILCDSLPCKGEVFCQSSVNFTVLFDTDDRATLRQYYAAVAKLCAQGIETDMGIVPVLLSGGAILNRGEKCTIDSIRSELVYAQEESHYYRRNELTFFDDPMNSAADTDIGLLAKIHSDALTDMDYFNLRYQPIADAKTGKTMGAEALLRWIHPEFGEVSPARFIEFLENDPCYYRLGLAIIEQAVRDATTIRKTHADFKINVNITAIQLQNEAFADNVLRILAKYAFPPQALVLELTERCKEMESTFLAARIAQLREKGIQIAFDDLGTGYSTISLLMDIPVDEIKLDRDFVKSLGCRDEYKVFVKALVQGSSAPGHSYNICFEGVENEQMLETVRGYGPFLVQGYYFSKPLLMEDFVEYINAHA